MVKFFATTSLALLVIICKAEIRDSIPLINSDEVITAALELNDEGSYAEAIEMLQTIPESDSNYYKMLSKLMLTYLSVKEYDKACETGIKGINATSAHKALFYTGTGNAFDKLEKKDSAVLIYKEGLKIYPYDYLLYYNLGLTLLSQDKIDESIAAFQKAIQLNPFHSTSHLMLGNIMAGRGQKTKAALSMATHLALSPTNNKALVLLNDLLKDALTYEGSLPGASEDKVFYEMDLLIRSKAALDEKYKTAIKFKAPVAQQLELVFSKLKMDAASDDFWMKNYVPLFVNLYEQGLQEAFIYHILTSTGDKNVDKYIKSHGDEMTNFYNHANQSFYNMREYHQAEVGGQEGKYKFWFYDNNQLNAIGNENNEGAQVGPWEFFHGNGEKLAIGSFNGSGEKIGKWEYFYDDGTLEKTEVYDENGDLNSPVYFYAKNGKVINEIPYKNNEVNGLVKIFYVCGNIKEEVPYKDGSIHGQGQTYYLNGGVDLQYSYQNDTLEGAYISFYRNGQKKEVYNYKKSKLTGEYIQFSNDGKVIQRGQYVDNEMDGEWLGYFKNGSVEFKGAFKNGKKSGTWIYYNENGTIMEEDPFTDGVRNGTYKRYDKDGAIHNEFDYVNDLLTGYRYFNKKGEIISQASDKKGNFKIKTFFPDGHLSGEGTYKNGKLNGAYTYYYHNGLKSIVVTYKDNLYHGLYSDYYEGNEQLKATVNYTDGVQNGYYKYYHQNGNLGTEGWMVDDFPEQTWINYYADGSILNRQYYVNGETHGRYEEYDPDGRLFLSSQHDQNYNLSTTQYDTLGGVRHIQPLDFGSGRYVLKNSKGKDRFTTVLNCHEYASELKSFYLDGRLETMTPVQSGEFNGGYKSYYKNGKPFAEGFYKNHLQEGKWIWYYENGAVETIGYYKNGTMDSVWTEFYENGQIESVGEYVDGEREGTYRFYDDSGALQVEKYYNQYGFTSYTYQDKDGNLVAPVTNHNNQVTAYFPSGKVSVKQGYKNGFLDGVEELYYATGQLFQKRTLDRGVTVGDSEEYYPNGNLKKVVPHQHGVTHGVVKEYHENGKLKKATSYKLDKKHGKQYVYDKSGKLVSEIVYINDYIY